MNSFDGSLSFFRMDIMKYLHIELLTLIEIFDIYLSLGS